MSLSSDGIILAIIFVVAILALGLWNVRRIHRMPENTPEQRAAKKRAWEADPSHDSGDDD